MRLLLFLTFALSLFAVGAATAVAQSPSPTASPPTTTAASPSPSASTSPSATAPASTPAATPTIPVTPVPQFPSSPQYLRAWPGLEEDSWYVYASGFTPRTGWIIGELLCPGLPCASLGSAVNDSVKEDGTMTFYVRLPRAADPTQPRALALTRYQTAGPIPEPVSAACPCRRAHSLSRRPPCGRRVGLSVGHAHRHRPGRPGDRAGRGA